MSVEDDTELRDLLTQTLEANGCLAKIRAQLRASVFLALDDDEEVNKKKPLLNAKIKTHCESAEGRIMFCIVREFLEFFDLDFTISVYEPESYLGFGYKYEGRYKIIQDLNIPALEENSPTPLLLQLLQIAKMKDVNKVLKIDLSHIQNNCTDSSKESSTKNSDHTNEENSKNDSATSNEEILSDISYQVNSDSSNDIIKPVLEVRTTPKECNLNDTFIVSSPTFEQNLNESSTKVTADSEIKSESEKLNSNGTTDIHSKDSNTTAESEINLKCSNKSDSDKSDYSVTEVDFSPPVLKESKFSKFDTSLEKLKKNDKLKPKNYSEFPPLQLNKSRGNDTMILPSLYSKEFKDKCALKDNDKFLDLDLDSMDNYEEDFMSGSDMDLSLNKSDFLKTEASKMNLLDDIQHMKISSNIKFKNIFGNKANDLTKQLKSPENSEKGKTEVNESKKDEKEDKGVQDLPDKVNDSSITSEDFDISSNTSNSC